MELAASESASASVCSTYLRYDDDHLLAPAADNSDDSCAQAQAATTMTTTSAATTQLAARRRGKRGGGCAGLRRRCYAVLKQQRTRLYILRRCVTMLLCWHEHDLSD